MAINNWRNFIQKTDWLNLPSRKGVTYNKVEGIYAKKSRRLKQFMMIIFNLRKKVVHKWQFKVGLLEILRVEWF